MHYKTITLGLIEQHPALYQRLCTSRTLLPALDQYALALKAIHEAWIKDLTQLRPQSSPQQLSSEALELAIEELTVVFQSASAESEDGDSLSLDAAMALLQRHMPPK